MEGDFNLISKGHGTYIILNAETHGKIINKMYIYLMYYESKSLTLKNKVSLYD